MRAIVKSICAAVCVLALTGPLKAAEPTAAHVNAAREMLALTQADQMFNAVLPVLLKQEIGQLEKNHPNLPAKVTQRFEILFLTEAQKGIEQAMQLVALAYAEALTEEEIGSISAFYKSPAGRKMIEIKPEMGQKALSIGVAWGKEAGSNIGKEVMLQLKAEGHKF